MTHVIATHTPPLSKHTPPLSRRGAANRNGRDFEGNTTLAAYIAQRPHYGLVEDELFDRHTGEKLG